MSFWPPRDDLFSMPPQPVTPIEFAAAHADELSTEFLAWLPGNLHIWDAFVEQANLVIKRGFDHYSSYTIVEFLRHHTALSERAAEFKINNNIRPYLSRLFGIMYPIHAGLFEYRVTTKPKGN